MPAQYAFRFPTALGLMTIAWSGEKVTATRLPELDGSAPNLKCEWSETPPAFVRNLAAQIVKHLAGTPQDFPLELLALENCAPFFRKVYACAHAIPPGRVRTYGELARAAGSPAASRAVGQAMARNPFPLVIPCHRVVGSNQALVGFSAPGGLDTKRQLLQIENHGTHH